MSDRAGGGVMTPAAQGAGETRLQRLFKVHGMDCAEEVAILKDTVGPLVGGADRLSFDILNGKMTVAAGVAVDDHAVEAAVSKTGMRVERWQEGNRAGDGGGGRHLLVVLTALSGALTFAGVVVHVALTGDVASALGSEGAGLGNNVPLTARLLYGAAVIAGGWHVAPKGWFALRRFRPDMNLLMTIAVIGAVLIDEWFEAATVAFLFALSLSLESWSIGRARRAVAALMALAPPVARVMDAAGGTRDVAPSEVGVGSRLLVKPGERIPLDGIVRAGDSDVNQAPITGESIPVRRALGMTVFAGTINGDGALEIESTKEVGDTTLARIVAMVADAQSRRAPSEQWVERFARVYTPVVFAVALAVLVVPPLLTGAPWSVWTYRALVLLVIGCPCALVISTPVTIVAALAAAARNGVLIKGGLFVEVPSRLRAIAFDKTGTLTTGNARVTSVTGLNGHTSAEVLERSAALETHADHPLALAILAHAREAGVVVAEPSDFRILQGKGAIGVVGGKTYWVGSHRYLEERGQETPDVHTALEALTSEGQTVVVVGTDDHVCGFIAIADSVRADAASVVARLRRQGIAHVVMLTGDNAGTARRMAALAGIDDVRADLLPADKVTAIEDLVTKYGQVAMVGDGVNDAPAMARASLAIAMGVAGSDAAIETADVALMSDDLSKIPWLIAHSQRAVGIVRQNIGLSLSIKGVFVVLTFAGAASLWAAISADMGVTLVVVANALRLLRSTGPTRQGGEPTAVMRPK